MNEWICSDTDSAQYYRKINDFVYDFIEIRNYIDAGYVVCISTVNISEYHVSDWWDACHSYYDSFTQMVETYDFPEVFHIIAECIFESMMLCEIGTSFEFSEYNEAEKFVNSWIANGGNLE